MEVVTGVASSVVEKILGYPVRLIGRHLGYLINYQTNKKNLTDRVPKLNEKISSIQRRARVAQRNGEQLEECVTGWISEAERKIQVANDVINDRGHGNAKCLCNGSFPNLLSRYKLSKQAKLMADNILIDLQNADNFRNFSYRPDVQPSFKIKDYEAFDTRMQTSKEIMEALRDPNLTMIGVYGMGGIGKTTLVTDVARQAKEEECFSELVMVTVSQDFDLKSIQNGIAEGLGLTLDGENMSVRAKRLQNRLRQGNKILIILDDIWDELDLSKAGIDFNADDQKGCKILLVSRVRDVLCNKMGVRKIIEVKVLSDSEAQGLFNKFVGDIDDNSEFKELANQLVGECGGLPIAIVTIACSLKNKDLVVWNGFLSQLKNSRGRDKKVNASIKMSYDFLESEEEKKLLLLCSLHGEDANVRVNDLMFYGIGLDLFQEVRAMEEARCWAHSLVDKLKAHCLLLDGDYEGFVKMHDVIRDVMISIAKKDEHMHCLTKVADLEDCLHKENFRDSKAIVLMGPDFNNQLLPSLVCPKLQLLLAFHTWYRRLSLGSIPDDFFQEAQELKALSFYCEPLESLPQSFCSLRHLRALRLQLGKKADLTLIGELRNLIALDLSESTFSQLPEHMGKLTRLQSLNLSYCFSLTVIQPNVISSLVRLEELYMDQVNIDWEVEGRVGEGCNASLLEFKNLRNLTTLHLNVRDANVLPKDMFSENLQRYRIMIGSISGYFTSSRFLCLNLRESSQLYQYGIQKLMKNSEGLWLEEFHGVDNIVYELDIYSFPQLKNFCLKNNDEVRYIVHSTEEIQPCSAFQNLETLNLENLRNLEKICYGNVTMESFGKLRKIYVRNCDKLKNLFSLSIARKFEKIEVSECKMMEMLVYHGSEHAAHGNINNEAISEKLEFPQLRSLKLYSLPNLIFFWSGLETTCGSSLSDSPQPLFGEKVFFPILKVLQLSGMNFIKLWSTTSCMQNLSSLDVSSCRNLKYLFTVAMAGRLVQLESLQICGCPEMEEVVVTNEHGEGRLEKILFSKLKSLELKDLPNLKRFCTGDCIECPSLLTLEIRNCGVLRKFISNNEEEVEGPFFNEKVFFPILKVLQLSGMNFIKLWSTTSCMQNLSSLDVSSCRNLKYLFTVAMAGRLVQLESLQICGCPEMEEVVVTNEHGEGRLEKILFSKLKSLELKDLPNLKRFFTGDCIECPSLLTLEIRNCGVLRKFISNNEEEVEGPFFNEKVFFPILKVLQLSGMNFIKLWSTTSCMQNLSSLDVSSCRNLKYLFTVAMAGRLAQLESLQICGCPEMEEVVVTNEHGEGRLEKILFSKLKSLELKDLPNLKRFCTGDCIECPSLITLEIRNCGVLRKFISSNEEEVEGPFFNEKVFFPILKVLQLSGMNFIKLWSTTSCMQNLSSLDVSSCRNLKYLFTVAMAGRLAQLESLQICGCPEMEEVVVTNEHGEGRLEKILFSKLKSLELKDLPNLKRFCTGDCIECPSLLTLEIRNCGVLRKFISSNEEEVEGPFFNEKVVFPRLKVLQLSGMNFIKLWSTTSCMQNLSSLNVSSCRNLKYLFTVAMAGRFAQLESLQICGCPEMEEVVVTNEHGEGRLEKILFSKLKSLKLKDLPNLKWFSTGDCIECPSLLTLEIRNCGVLRKFISNNEEEVEGPFFNEKVFFPILKVLQLSGMNFIKLWSTTSCMQNLSSLDVSSCRNLKYLFTVAMAGRLAQLESLQICGCPEMEEVVVTNEHGKGRLEKILFSKLKSLELKDLPNLKRFCTGDCIECPSLLTLEIRNCGVLRKFISNNEEEVEGPFFNEKVFFPILKVLQLSGMNFIKLWSTTSCMQNLSSLDVSSCRNLKYLFTVAMVGRLAQLESLQICGCPEMEEVVVTNEHGEGRLEKILFPKLKSLKFKDLPNLKRFCTGDCIECPSLLKLEIMKCGVLRKFISSNEEEVEGPFFNEKVFFPILKVLQLSGMNFIKLWSTTSCMQNLSSLDVSSCRNLKYLFTVAMVGRLAQLESLQLCGCLEMEEVVVTNEHGEGRLEKILFPKLKSLKFKDLPNLKRFCSGDCIECPSLLKLEIMKCGVLRKFISSNEEEVEGPFFNEKVSFPILKELQLKRMNLKILWADQLSITSFGMQNLKRLFIKDIDSLSHLFSLDVARSLQQLEDLQLEACKDMEEVLVTKEPIEEGTPQKISFPKLKNLVLSNLQNIRRFCAGCCIEFPSLTNMTFTTDSCNGASGELMGSEARQPLFNGKVLSPNLVELTTTSSELIKEMCDCQSSRALPFCNLNVVDLECFCNEPIGFSLKCIQRYQNLESLSLSGFFVDTTHHHQQLMVSSEEHERPLKRLKKLWLVQLSMLTHLYEDSKDFENSSLESLKFLHILECGKLMSPLLSLTASFQNLMALVVSECFAMINLLASSTAKTLVHLRLMSITKCKQMIEIIMDGIVDDEIVFRNLEILELSDLPSLKSFHSAGNSVMIFPNLVMLVVSQCPEMRRFSFGTIDAPKLDSISEIKKNKYRWDELSEISFDDEMSRLPEPQQKLWEGDINKTLEKHWEEDYSLVMQRLFTET